VLYPRPAASYCPIRADLDTRQPGFCAGRRIDKKAIEIAKHAITKVSDNQFIAGIIGLTVEQIAQVRNEKE
jgi:hypothetical protein